MKIISLVVVMGLAAGATLAFAADQVVNQKGRKFSITEVSLRKGEVLTFVNDDNISHNVLSTTPGNEFNLRSQPPGSSTPVTFDKVGDIKIICAIHPAMQMMVKVSE